MSRLSKFAAVSLLALSLVGCPASTLHKVTVAEHDFAYTVQAFEDVEIAEHDQGFVSDAEHLQIQEIVQRVALGGIALDNALVAGAANATLKAKLDGIQSLLNSQAAVILSIKNPNSKARLEIALAALKAIIANGEVFIQ